MLTLVWTDPSAAAAECCQLFCSHTEVTLFIRKQPKG